MEVIMRSILFVLFPLVILSGCEREASNTIPELRGRVLTVDEYLAQPQLREKVSAFCRNDPGRSGMTPNCVNVRQADHIVFFSKPGKIRFDLGN
jgi:hypothetical protein